MTEGEAAKIWSTARRWAACANAYGLGTVDYSRVTKREKELLALLTAMESTQMNPIETQIAAAAVVEAAAEYAEIANAAAKAAAEYAYMASKAAAEYSAKAAKDAAEYADAAKTAAAEYAEDARSASRNARKSADNAAKLWEEFLTLIKSMIERQEK